MKARVHLLALLLAASCSQKPENKTTTLLDHRLMAKQLIKQASPASGERVLLVAQPGKFDPLIPLLQEEIVNSGAVYLGTASTDSVSWPPEWNTEFTSGIAGKSRSELTEYFRSVDLGIMLPGAAPSDQPYAAMQDVLRLGQGRTIHFHWAGAYDLSNALMETSDSIALFYQHVLFNTDYEKLALVQQTFESAARQDSIRVTTPAGTDIRFFIGDRPVTKQDGNASLAHMSTARNLIDREVELPAGAIRVAPLEESVFGKIAFPNAKWDGQDVEGLVITIQAGKIVNMTATKGLEAVQKELSNAGEAGQHFREFAIGFNPLLAIPKTNPWIPYYGYGAGVVRLSLGDNTELGGKIGGGYVRWNFFTDASVTIGQERWIDSGVLLK